MAWNSIDADLLDDIAPNSSYLPGGLRRAAPGSARIRKTTLVFQALLIVAMLVAVVAIILGPNTAGQLDATSPDATSPDATSPDAPPPSVFVFPAD